MLRTILFALGTCAFVTGHAHWNDVDIQAPDGVTLRASYISPAKQGPAMLLLHQCNMDRSAWADIGRHLHDAGIHVLALDFRGFGDSEGEGLRGAGGFGGFLAKSQGDVDAAYDYLAGKDLVDSERIAAGGASCGAMLSAELATRRPVRSLLLLSGPPSDAAIANIAAQAELAVFAAAAEGDTITPGVAEVLAGAVAGSQHASSTARTVSGTEHGMPMFAKHPDLEAEMLEWLEQQLLPE